MHILLILSKQDISDHMTTGSKLNNYKSPDKEFVFVL